MSTILRPGAGFLFMKVGTHAQESLGDIIDRKKKEIEAAGFAFWGYGGNTCHPQTMVQPFAKTYEVKGETIYLCMHEMDSRHFAVSVRADEFSEDGRQWQTIPSDINVKGSRYALVVTNLRQESFDLPLSNTRVAVGNSQGRRGDDYVSGRVDKACLELTDIPTPQSTGRTIHIDLVAELKSPYAVYVRNRS